MKPWLSVVGAASLALGIAATAPADAQDVVRIGTEGAYPPWNFTNADGELDGFEIELADALCERMGATCEFVAQDWDGIIPALLQGRYDAIMAGMSINDERRERIAFTNGYATTPAWFVARSESPLQDLTTVDEVVAALDGVAVGTQSATVHQGFIERYIPNADLRTYDTQEALNLGLEAGEVEAGLADGSGWSDFLASEYGAGFAQFGPSLTGADFSIFGEGVGIGLRKDDTALIVRFNTALCEMADDGSLASLTVDWFGLDASMPCRD